MTNDQLRNKIVMALGDMKAKAVEMGIQGVATASVPVLSSEKLVHSFRHLLRMVDQELSVIHAGEDFDMCVWME